MAKNTVKVPTADELLVKASDHMRQRASIYEPSNGEAGERSMIATVTAFNVITRSDLTEAQGWLFMQLLKDVRLFAQPGYHADSAEDSIAYTALMAEAKAKEVVE